MRHLSLNTEAPAVGSLASAQPLSDRKTKSRNLMLVLKAAGARIAYLVLPSFGPSPGPRREGPR